LKIGDEISMNKQVKILGIAGSLRKGSYNRAALNAARQLCPQNATIEVFELQGIPLFNQDLENPPPPIVANLKDKIRSSDSILFATPEYNYSVPGVLKNAIDWASRPYGDSAWEGKPAAIMGASVGMLGTARAQYHLRQMFVFLNMFALNRPEVMIPYAADKFDKEGNLTDAFTKEMIRQLMDALVNWTIKHQEMQQQQRITETS
jgi:chromate reductase